MLPIHHDFPSVSFLATQNKSCASFGKSSASFSNGKLDVLAIAIPQHEDTDLPTYLVYTLLFTSSMQDVD
jgi:hypothetical protein